MLHFIYLIFKIYLYQIKMSRVNGDSIYDLSEGTFYSISNDLVVLILPCCRTIYFNGIVDVRVLSGTVEVSGHTLLRGKMYTLFSPKGTSLLGIDAINDTETTVEEVCNYVPTNITDILSRYQRDNCLLLLKRNYKLVDFVRFLKQYVSFHLFPCETEYITEVEKKLHCLFETVNTSIKRFMKSEEWEPVENIISRKVNVPRLILCGGLGVGKSTLLRYLINKALNIHKKVLVLDFDPGQSEFTVMGCISAVVIDEPLFGPNFCHLKVPIYSLYLGSIAVSSCVKQYLECVQKLINFCNSNDVVNEMPWIVNTMGFSKGIGVKLTSSVICCLSPTDLVQINSNYRDCNFPTSLTEEFVTSENVLLPEIHLKRHYKLHVFTSAYEENSPRYSYSIAWGLKAALKRDIVTLSYFFETLDHCDSYLTECEPYRVDGSSVEIIIPESQYDFTLEEKFEIVNGNMVALCRKDTNDVLHWLGFGIIRATDFTRTALYIITPLKNEMCSNLNAIVIGKYISLPSDVYTLQYKHVTVCDDIPYVQNLSSDNDLNKNLRRTYKHPNRRLYKNRGYNDSDDACDPRDGKNDTVQRVEN